MNNTYMVQSINVYPHHIKQNICGSRAKYREGRKDTAVKVYTINQESIYLLISNVPAIGGSEQLQAICEQYGNVVDFKPLDEYPTEEFTEVFLIKYDAVPSARTAKRQLDDKSFLGGILHCCYAPEFESVAETREKLHERRKFFWKANSGPKKRKKSTHTSQSCIESSSYISNSSYCSTQEEPVSYIWAGTEYTLPSSSTTSETDAKTRAKPTTSTSLFVPRQCKSGRDSNSFKAVSKYNYGQSTSTDLSTSDQDSSYHNTISQVRSKVASVSVPIRRVSFKRKKRI